MYQEFEVRKPLIVAPLRVARDTWPAEIQKWDHLEGMTWSVITGTAQERLAALHPRFPADDILKTDADLQLSGHTHAGQYFPLRFVYMLARLNVVGEYRIGNTDLYVSPGIGGWGMPFRNESRSQFEYVHIMPQE